MDRAPFILYIKKPQLCHIKKYNVRNESNNNNAIYTNGGWYIIVHLPYTLRVGGLVTCLCLLSACVEFACIPLLLGFLPNVFFSDWRH